MKETKNNKETNYPFFVSNRKGSIPLL